MQSELLSQRNLTLATYGALVAYITFHPSIPAHLVTIVNHNVTKLIVAGLIAYLASKDITAAILLALAYIVTYLSCVEKFSGISDVGGNTVVNSANDSVILGTATETPIGGLENCGNLKYVGRGGDKTPYELKNLEVLKQAGQVIVPSKKTLDLTYAQQTCWDGKTISNPITPPRDPKAAKSAPPPSQRCSTPVSISNIIPLAAGTYTLDNTKIDRTKILNAQLK